jgi:hypothetical protein
MLKPTTPKPTIMKLTMLRLTMFKPALLKLTTLYSTMPKLATIKWTMLKLTTLKLTTLKLTMFKPALLNLLANNAQADDSVANSSSLARPDGGDGRTNSSKTTGRTANGLRAGWISKCGKDDSGSMSRWIT